MKMFFVTIFVAVIAFVSGLFVGWKIPVARDTLTASLVGVEKEKDAENLENMEKKAEEGAMSEVEKITNARVVRVLDGDTIEIEGGIQVHYIGVDAPENLLPEDNVCFARKATLANEILVGGKTVRLVRDVSHADVHGRLLRYVYVENPEGGELFVNVRLIEDGTAKAAHYPPDVKFQKAFDTAQAGAVSKELGFWSECKKGS